MALALLLFMPLVTAGFKESALYFSDSDKGPHISRHSLFRVEFKLGYRLKLFCEAEGDPIPEITWYKDGREISLDGRTTIFEEYYKLKGISRLQIQLTRIGDAGEYECVAHNRNGAHIQKFRTQYTL